MKKIIATWNPELRAGSDLMACSFSEQDEIFDVGEWVYDLPEGYQKYSREPAEAQHEVLMITGQRDGQEYALGFAARPVAWVCFAEIFHTWEDLVNSQFFHPSDWQPAFTQAQAERIQKKQEEMFEDGCYGD